SKLSVGKVNKAEYTGEAIEPKPVVKDGRTVLTEGTHYTLEYERNIEVGTAFVVIKGKTEGGYAGKRRLSFNLNIVFFFLAVLSLYNSRH
ncbi:MAG: hypothetical protein K6G27_02300, partial [Lachnospiraceae bacterium]|nr:hypothetical protein [Lachnospiraceae bacterium]